MNNNQRFEGFPKEVIDFLWELRFNNHKEWFDNNRDRYISLLKEPINSFAWEMCQVLKDKTGTEFYPAVSRINRDIRFSKNKEPYKDHMWVVFKRDSGSWKNKPVIFFELGTDYYMLGMGIYESLPAYMKGFRKAIDSNIAEFERLIKIYDKSKEFKLEGDFYKKINADDKSKEVSNWYTRKGISLIYRKEIDNLIFNRDILDFSAEGFIFLLPMLNYMMRIDPKAL